MIKPATFSGLPYALQEPLLWQMDLDYDFYESSMAETVHSIQCNYPYDGSRNDRIIKEFYATFTVEKLETWVRGHISGLEDQIQALKKMLD